MPHNCCVPGCHKKGYRKEGDKNITFHSFPKLKSRKKAWLAKIRRDEGKDFVINDNTKVCSKHFTSNCYITGKQRRYLSDTAVPTIFSWNAQQQLRRSPRKRIDFSSVQEQTVQMDPVKAADLDQGIENMLPEMEESPKTISGLDLKCNNTSSELLDKIKELEQELEQCKFCFEQLSDNDIYFYTGFPSKKRYLDLYDILDPGEDGENIVYWSSRQVDNYTPKAGRRRILSPIDQMLLVLVRLRQGFFEKHLSYLFKVSIATVNRICLTWINFLYLKLGAINIWPSKEMVMKTMPLSFKQKYHSTRVIIDCTELKCEVPSSLLLQSETYSSYKSSNTYKGLIGISPSGGITFVSQLYSGSISDREIVERSGFLNLPFDKEDSVMADKGFTIADLLQRKGVKLNIPPFLGKNSQMSSNDVIETQHIAAVRIHVERAINRIKSFHIFDSYIDASISGSINQMWTVCCLLTNFFNPLIAKTE